MKYDEMEKTEMQAYPNENVLREASKKRRPKYLDIALAGVIFCVSFALVMLFTTLVSLTASGVLKDVMSALIK